MEIRKLGKLHKLDSDGNIENPSVLPVQQEEYRNVVNQIIDELLLNFKDVILSVYIRGSVAKAAAIPYVSDIDLIILSNRNLDENENLLRKKISENVGNKNPFVNGVELFFMNADELSKIKTQFLFKTQCACVYGNDVIPSIQKFKIGRDAIVYSEGFYDSMMNIIKELSVEEDENEIKEICSWVMKKMIRTAFETVMMRDNSFTRDLYPCYEIFSKYHPEKESEIRKALELAINPTDNKLEILETINGLVNYIKNEIKYNVGS